MKKILITMMMMMILAATSTLFAKQKVGIDFGIGLKGGLNFNKVVATEWKDKFSTGPHAGFFAYINKHRFGIQVEGIWSQGAITTDSSFYGLYKQYYNQASDSLKGGSFSFSSISIPLLVNIKLARFLWLQGGPQYSAHMNVVDESKLLKSGREIIKQGDMNLVGGLWIQFGKESFHINAGVRYISGINNLSNLQTITGVKSEWKNQMIQAHLGFGF